jgi:hypothetical protein
MLLWETVDSAAGDTDEQITKHWFRKIYSFTKMSDTLLLGWISGVCV